MADIDATAMPAMSSDHTTHRGRATSVEVAVVGSIQA
jgi:hypothetical protein